VAESRELLRRLSHGRSQIWYSGPTAEDRVGRNFDAAGPLAVARFDALKVTRAVDFYVWGPTAFTRALCTDLANRSVPEHANPYRNVRLGGTPHGGHRRVALSTGAFLPGPRAAEPLVSITRSNLAIRWHPKYESLLELAEACDVLVRWSCHDPLEPPRRRQPPHLLLATTERRDHRSLSGPIRVENA